MVRVQFTGIVRKYIKKCYPIFIVLIFARRIICSFNIVRYTSVKKEISQRKRKSILDFQELSKTLSLYTTDLYSENSLYGNKLAIKNVLKCKPTFKMLIEHGYHFGNFVSPSAFDVNNVSIITYSSERNEHIKKAFLSKRNNAKTINIVTIGPYINYADSVLDQMEKNRIKEKYGKILLVFPSHSIEGVIYKYNTQDFINEIEKVSKDFDSVFICMYWKDIQDGRYAEYENNGYKIVTAGHRNDPNFLGRLKDIIDLSDMTMSNTVGTHIGYCVARNKPHYLFNQFQEVEGNKVEEEFKERRNYDYIRTRDKEVGEVTVAFSSISYSITDEQKRVVEKYWGENKVEYHTVKKEGIS